MKLVSLTSSGFTYLTKTSAKLALSEKIFNLYRKRQTTRTTLFGNRGSEVLFVHELLTFSDKRHLSKSTLRDYPLTGVIFSYTEPVNRNTLVHTSIIVNNDNQAGKHEQGDLRCSNPDQS